MKKIIALMCTALFSFAAHADYNSAGNSSAMGPRVTCELPNGNVEYIPSEICKAHEGKILYWN
ncbi:hypothetical protein BIY21_16445 [Vibrio ponticus]|uniref:DUF333 domain-containing protein n=1 Tax=Vibrio ponticus TaxID=265668 RepID=A0A3N3E5N9_9VIBR|nr:hypothetical protein [Vibrio ponticus]OLQ88568.1 hypothetical protein BIY21_16445 [Vibrio ponticus]ROV62052.1 hypothetical protein EGH82_03035 [Vibrio ponticus]